MKGTKKMSDKSNIEVEKEELKTEHSECGGRYVEMVKKINDSMPCEEEFYDLSELFKMLSDSTRVKILYALSQGEMCVCDIVELLDVTQSAVSHQLRLLKQARLVKYRRSGKSAIYSISDDHVYTILSMGMEHISE